MQSGFWLSSLSWFLPNLELRQDNQDCMLPIDHGFDSDLQGVAIKVLPAVQVFIDSSMPIINFYDAKGRVRKIDADSDPEKVYAEVRPLVAALQNVAA